MFRHHQVLKKKMLIKTARNLNKSEGGCISYLHGARKSWYSDVLSRCRISSLVALFQRLREKRESFFQFIWKRELKGEYKGRSCIVLHPCFPGHGKCKCWLLFVYPFHNKSECPKSEATLQKLVWCTWRILEDKSWWPNKYKNETHNII